MELQILGAHQGESDRYRFLSIMVGDTLAVDAGSLTTSLSWEAQRRIQSLLITHAHYDHIKDLNILAFNHMDRNLKVYCLPAVREAIQTHMFSRDIWLDLAARPTPESPAVTFHPVEPFQPFIVEGYEVTAFPSIHTVPTLGFRLRQGDKGFFYTSDTGPGNFRQWQKADPDLLITEVTFSNRMDQWATEVAHLTPNRLKWDLVELRKALGRLPRILIVHINPLYEEDIAREMEETARDLGADITLAHEGMRIQV